MSQDTYCSSCGQSLDHEQFIADLSQALAEDLDEAAERYTRQQDTDEARWFAQGIGFATMWLRARRT